MPTKKTRVIAEVLDKKDRLVESKEFTSIPKAVEWLKTKTEKSSKRVDR